MAVWVSSWARWKQNGRSLYSRKERNRFVEKSPGRAQLRSLASGARKPSLAQKAARFCGITIAHGRSQANDPGTAWGIQDNRQRQVFEMYAPPDHLFAVVSWGCAATKWLSNVLNSHPDIFCVHAARTLWSHVAGPQTLSDLDYLRIIATVGSGCVAAGEVHGISRESAPLIRERLGDQFRAIVVVREPMPRLLSFMSLGRRFDYSPEQDLSYLKTIQGFDRIAHLVTNREREYFAHGANLLNAIVDELQVGPIFKCEEFTANPAALTQLFSEVTGGAVTLDSQVAEQLVTREKLNAHSAKVSRAEPEIHLESWQHDVLRAMLRAEAKKIYEQLGYSSFGF